MLRRTPLPPGGPLRPMSAKRVRVNRQRTKVVNGLREAQQGRCARCHQRTEIAGHERRGRAQGGSILAPECALCHRCNTACEDNPREAAWAGWKVSPKHPHDPALAIGEAWDINGDRVIFADLSTAVEV
jgi:hypothetical protein